MTSQFKQLQPFRFTYARSSAGVSLSHPFNFQDKQVIWLVGASGSGKSTFLHLLKGFHPEFLAGEVVGENPAVFKDAMYMAQNPLSQIVHERVGEEFFFTLENQHSSIDIMQAARVWLAQFGLSEREFDSTLQLSHGLAQRLVLASQLATQADWLLLDEPTAFLNAQMRDAFYDVLKTLKSKVGMVLIDHHPHAAQFADVCWHVDAQGAVTEMSVAQWLALQERDLALETSNLSTGWEVSALADTFEFSAHDVEIGYKSTPLFSLNCRLKSGECAVLRGENGAGKSTLFNTLAGMQKPLSGRLDFKINGTSLKSPRQQMSYVFQHPDSHFYFDTIEQDLQQLGVDDVDATLAKIGLAGTAQRSPHQLSEGQKRRLTLLYPCLQNRALVLLDEPTFGQDALNILRITRLINALKHAGHALIVITHDAQVEAAIADVVWTIENKQLLVRKSTGGEHA